MTRVLHTARISNVEIIKGVVNNKDGKAMGSIPVGDSEFFFVPCSCHC